MALPCEPSRPGGPAKGAAYCLCLITPRTPQPREAEHARGEVDEAHMQLRVLLQTVAALQAGGGGDNEQAIADLSTQLCAARGREAALQRRAGDLLVGVRVLGAPRRA
jgi:hypothetical protein